jgi:hypothetical protein
LEPPGQECGILDEARSPSGARVIVVQNWIEELKQRVTVE